MEKKRIKIDKFLDNLFKNTLIYGIDIAVDSEGFNKRLEMARKYTGLYLSIGFSPAHVLNPNWNMDLNIIEDYTKEDKIVGIGETGLDWHWNYGTKQEQIELFENQLVLADKLNLPVIIHNRNADKEIIETLKRVMPKRAGLIHCFSSDYSFALKVLDMGFYISFAGNLTYKKALNIQDTAKRIPLDRLLLETDSPYLAPVPFRGKINNPEYISHIYSYFTDLRGMKITEAVDCIEKNFKRLFLKKLI